LNKVNVFELTNDLIIFELRNYYIEKATKLSQTQSKLTTNLIVHLMQHLLANAVYDHNFYILSNHEARKVKIIETIGIQALRYIKQYVDIEAPTTRVFSQQTYIKIHNTELTILKSLINLNPLNIKDFNSQFIEFLNKNLILNGVFVGRFDTRDKLTQNILTKKYLRDLFLKKRDKIKRKYMLPNIKVANNKIYRRKIDIFGRLGYLGFDIISESEIGDYYYFVAKKTSFPSDNPKPTSSPIIKLKRVSRYGKIITIFKFRTMYPYSEYLQEYIYKNNRLHSCGKFNNDRRISKIGNFLRKHWIDELPMIVNLIKGDIKLFGVRPLSRQYFELYPEDLRQIRIAYKPGLIPPYYADMPKDFEEILISEKRYLMAYQKKPLLTDLKYLAKVFFNILIRFKRSK
jgi:lipopolysaccharide/colanic/teichoic acid biosynthesis glycosyltransferase